MRHRLVLAASVFLCTGLLLACGEPPVEERLTGVQQMLRESRFDDAIAELRQILDTDPDHGRANLLLAVAFQRTSQPTLAVWPLEKAFNDGEFRVRAGLQLGNLHLSLGNPTDAQRVATRLLEAEPENVEAHRIRARAYLADKRFEDALGDAQWLIEQEPGSAVGLVLKGSILSDMKRNEEAEETFREAIALTEETPADNERAWVVLCAFLAQNTEDPERAEKAFEEAREIHPESAALRGAYITFLQEAGRNDEVEAVLRASIEREPENFQLRVQLAQNLRVQGRPDEADATLAAATEEFPMAASWHMLGRTRLDAGDFAGAREALEKAVELAPQDESLRFLLAEAIVRAGDPERARELVDTFERKPYQHFVEGLIALESEQYAEALDRFEMGLRHWPDNPGARYNAGIAAQRLGDWDRAINEFTEAARTEMSATRNTSEPFQTEAALQLARIYSRRAEHGSAVYWARVHLQHHPEAYDAMLLIARSLRDQGATAQARAQLEAMLELDGVAPDARADLVSLEFQQGDVEKAERLIDEAEPGNLRLLSIAVERDVERRGVAEALARLDRAAASGAYEEAALHALRGRVLHAGARTAEAELAFRKALELEPDQAGALAALGTVRASRGDFEEGVVLLRRAAEAEPENVEHLYRVAQLELQLGRNAEAREVLRDVVRMDPGHAEARNDLAWLLASETGNLDEAFRIGSEAYRLNKGSVFADTLGWIHYLRGEYPLAVDLLSRAASQTPDDPTVRYHLGMALARHGESGRALKELRAAVETGGFTEEEQARTEIARLEGLGS